jgi:hypothetical protein
MRGGLVAGILFPILGKLGENAKNEKQSAVAAAWTLEHKHWIEQQRSVSMTLLHPAS